MAPVVYKRAQRIVPGTRIPPKRAALMACETAGWINLVLESGDILPYYATVGSYELGSYAIADVNFVSLPGSAATCTVSNLSEV